MLEAHSYPRLHRVGFVHQGQHSLLLLQCQLRPREVVRSLRVEQIFVDYWKNIPEDYSMSYDYHRNVWSLTFLYFANSFSAIKCVCVNAFLESGYTRRTLNKLNMITYRLYFDTDILKNNIFDLI